MNIDESDAGIGFRDHSGRVALTIVIVGRYGFNAFTTGYWRCKFISCSELHFEIGASERRRRAALLGQLPVAVVEIDLIQSRGRIVAHVAFEFQLAIIADCLNIGSALVIPVA